MRAEMGFGMGARMRSMRAEMGAGIGAGMGSMRAEKRAGIGAGMGSMRAEMGAGMGAGLGSMRAEMGAGIGAEMANVLGTEKGGKKKKGKFNVDIKSDYDEERRKITFTQEVRDISNSRRRRISRAPQPFDQK